MKIRSQKRQRTTLLITVALAIIAATVGFLVFLQWQNQAQDVKNTSLNATSGLTNTIQEAVNRPTLGKGAPDHLSIPDRKIEAPIVYVAIADESAFQDALAGGVVHYPGTPEPGELGNPYIFGHSSDYAWKPGNYKRVLKPLVDIPLGTIVNITNHTGELFVYKVIETKIVGPKNVSVLDQYNNERRMLTLQTSWPIGTALKRFIAICELDDAATYGPVGQ